MAPCFFVLKGGAPPDDVLPTLEGLLNKRGGATGQRGGFENWKARYFKIVGHTLYYLEDKKSKSAKGHMNLQGVGVREADGETGRLLSICVFWPEDAEACFYMQAPNSYARKEWMKAIARAAQVSDASLDVLGIAELKQRCVASGLVQEDDYSNDRARLQQMLADFVAQRKSSRSAPLAVLAARAHHTTGAGARTSQAMDAGKQLVGDGLRWLRGKVSLNKCRFQKDGFDLDLTYIVPGRLIAMGFPSVGIEAKYRNSLDEVRRFFGTYHPANRWRVYNLCEERVYIGEDIGGASHADCLRHFPFDDHNPPCIDMVHVFCLDVRAWLEAHPENVAAVHCKAGKGRTGLMCACLLVHLGVCATAEEALAYFGGIRTSDGEGVTIPSQKRYTRWYAAHHGHLAAPLAAGGDGSGALPSAGLPMPVAGVAGERDLASAGTAAQVREARERLSAADLGSGEASGSPAALGAARTSTAPPVMAAAMGPAMAAGSLEEGSTDVRGRSLTSASSEILGAGSVSAFSPAFAARMPELWRAFACPRPVLRVTRLAMRGCPTFDRFGGCDPYVVLKMVTAVPRELFGAAEEANPNIVGCTQCTQRFKRVYDSRKVQEVFHVEHGGAIEFDVKSRPLLIKGDVKVQFCDENTVRKKDKMCHFWVHSHFLLNQSQGRLHLRRANTDKACKGKYASRFPPEFEIILEAELDAEADVSSALSNDAEFGFGDRHSCFVEGDGMDDLPEDTDTEDEEEEEAAAAAQAGADGGGAGGGDDDGGDGDGGGAPEHSQKTRTSYVEQLTKQRRASNQSVMV